MVFFVAGCLLGDAFVCVALVGICVNVWRLVDVGFKVVTWVYCVWASVWGMVACI